MQAKEKRTIYAVSIRTGWRVIRSNPPTLSSFILACRFLLSVKSNGHRTVNVEASTGICIVGKACKIMIQPRDRHVQDAASRGLDSENMLEGADVEDKDRTVEG